MTVTAEDLRVDESYVEPVRPRRRSDCENGARPCPWASCKFNLLIDVNPKTGRISENGEVDEMRDTCALDVTARGGVSQAEIAPLFNLTRARIDQIEAGAIAKLRTTTPRELLEGWTNPTPALGADGAFDWDDFGPDFKDAVHRAYERIVPANERGKSLLSYPGVK